MAEEALEVHVETPNKEINVTETTNPRYISRFYLRDSLFKFHPYCEFYFRDDLGYVADKMFFMEGLTFTVSMGTPTLGYLKNDYCWSENQLNDVRIQDHLVGTNVFILIGKPYVKDFNDTKAYRDTPSNVARTIADSFEIPTNKRIIESTTNPSNDIWYQAGKSNRDFLKEVLAVNAFNQSASNTNSPFISCMNCAGEFIFSSINNLFQQPSIKTFKLELTEDTNMVSGKIKFFMSLHGGLISNKPNYKKTFHGLKDTGEFEANLIQLKEQYLKTENADKMLVLRENVGVSNPINTGIVSEELRQNISGRVNTSFMESYFSYRTILVDKFDPALVVGKTIEINIDKYSDSYQRSVEWGGKWLIIESEHHTDFEQGGFTKLTLAKPSIRLSTSNSFYKSII